MDLPKKIAIAGPADGKPLKAPRRTMRPVRALLYLLLRTAVWTALITISGLYCLNEVPIPALNGPRQETRGAAPEPAAPPGPEAPAPYAISRTEPPRADSFAMIRRQAGQPDHSPANTEKPEPRPRKPVLRPVGFGSSGGNFAAMRREESEAASGNGRRQARASRRDYYQDGAIVLSEAALSKKIKVKGSAPVSKSLEERYTGTDREGEIARKKKELEFEAARARQKQLRREQLTLAGLLTLGTALVMLTGSRLVKAVKLLHKPEGRHWTLK
ncbi:MAG: hypothetical protein COT18_03550 [Elusimicrobia bacterium CG08_land_8_20_14_0_20_59_10]|nr:MAG: hypothetical protein COT18_03550 [Elusimicrobia bacterium CG08_land_8_20_14_0_20_59_10]